MADQNTRYVFTYPNYGTPDGYPELTAHSGQTCQIVRQLRDDECDPECQPMFIARFADGTESIVNGDELAPIDVFCRFCQQPAGSDYHLAGAVPPGQNNVVCDRCWDERLR